MVKPNYFSFIVILGDQLLLMQCKLNVVVFAVVVVVVVVVVVD